MLADQQKKVVELEQQLANSKTASTSKRLESTSNEADLLKQIAALKKDAETRSLDNQCLMDQVSALLRLPSSSSAAAGDSVSLQNEISRLTAMNVKNSEDIKTLKEANHKLEQTNAEYRADINKMASTSGTIDSVPQIFGTTRRNARKILSKVNVEAAISSASQKYMLRGPIESNTLSYAADNESDNNPTQFSYMLGQKPKRKSPYLFQTKKGNTEPGLTDDKEKQKAPTPPEPSIDVMSGVNDTPTNTTPDKKDKGKQKASTSRAEMSSDEEDIYSDNDVESKVGRTRAFYSRKGIRARWTKEAQEQQSNKLVRTQLREMLNVTKNNDGTRRPGIEQVSKSRLDDFLNGAAESGPGLRCTYLDTSGQSIDEFMASEWNQIIQGSQTLCTIELGRCR
ncbi:hypothetical protein FB446DRAFT_754214 [Lentinula raphanica]|nr:hypothetical protein FB446DRAFT_754214 [Lentinula raphanica]